MHPVSLTLKQEGYLLVLDPIEHPAGWSIQWCLKLEDLPRSHPGLVSYEEANAKAELLALTAVQSVLMLTC